MHYSTNSLRVFACALSTLLHGGQEPSSSAPEKRSLEERRNVQHLAVEVPLRECNLKNIPERCLSTPLEQQSSSDEGSSSTRSAPLSEPSAPTNKERFSWTPDTPQMPAWKKPFLWLKDSTGKLLRYVFDE
jgi:hypothetical protein